MPLCSVFPSTERAHELCTLLGSKSHLKGLGHEIEFKNSTVRTDLGLMKGSDRILQFAEAPLFIRKIYKSLAVNAKLTPIVLCLSAFLSSYLITSGILPNNKSFVACHWCLTNPR
jgi:hypothetical protein